MENTMPDIISIESPLGDNEILSKLKSTREKMCTLMLNTTNIKSDSEKYYDLLRVIVDEFDETIENMNCREGWSSLYGRRIKIHPVNNAIKVECADCGNEANYAIEEENGNIWLYCGECAVGG